MTSDSVQISAPTEEDSDCHHKRLVETESSAGLPSTKSRDPNHITFSGQPLRSAQIDILEAMMLNAVKAPQYVLPKGILLADHFTDDSSRAFEYARAIALRFGTHVTIAHVSEFVNPIATPEGSALEALGYTGPDSKAELAQRVENLRACGVAVDSMERSGPVVRELIAGARERSADLMILGTHAPHGLERLFFGSESEKTADESGWPVMIVGPHARPAPAGKWLPSRILCLLQPAECSVAAAVYGVRMSQALSAEATFFMIFSEDRENHSAAFEDAFALELPGVRMGRDIEFLYVPEDILLDLVVERAKSEDVGAIVMCSEVENFLHTHGYQTFLSRLLSVSPCPVIVTGRGV